MAEPTPAPGTSPTREESAWLIERHIGGVLYYWTGRPKIGEWSTDVNDARRFSRREDASCMLTWHCDDIGRAVEHLWLAALGGSNG
jgi:nitroreductase